MPLSNPYRSISQKEKSRSMRLHIINAIPDRLGGYPLCNMSDTGSRPSPSTLRNVLQCHGVFLFLCLPVSTRKHHPRVVKPWLPCTRNQVHGPGLHLQGGGFKCCRCAQVVGQCCRRHSLSSLPSQLLFVSSLDFIRHHYGNFQFCSSTSLDNLH